MSALWAGRSGFRFCAWVKDFFFPKMSWVAAAPTQPPIQWVPWVPVRVEAAGTWSWPYRSRAGDKIVLSCTCVPPYAFTVCTWRTLVNLLCLTASYLISLHLSLPYLPVTFFHKSHEPHICSITILLDRPSPTLAFRSYGRNFTLTFEASPS